MEEKTTQIRIKRGNIAKRTIKDSVFSDLFNDKKYLIQLYQSLHPEDTTATEDDLTDVTIRNVLTDGIYNDLGFAKGGKLFILMEAQATWTVNIIIRAFLYLAQTYHDYFERTNQNLYKRKKAEMPKPELYVVYTGNERGIPDTISLSEEFFDGVDIAIDVKIKVICENDTDSIINQYILFSKVYDEQRKMHGRTKKAIMETVRICKDRNILKEYLEAREQEVISIMMSLYDQEEVMKSYIKSERYEAEQETARRLIKKGKMSLEEIADCVVDLSLEDIRKLEAELRS